MTTPKWGEGHWASESEGEKLIKSVFLNILTCEINQMFLWKKAEIVVTKNGLEPNSIDFILDM